MKLAPDQFERILRTLHGPPVAHDRRRAERFPVSTPLDFTLGDHDDAQQWTWIRGLTHDISEMGLGLVTVMSLEPGQRVMVRLPDGAGGELTIRCTVAHARAVTDGLYCAGLEFVESLESFRGMPPLAAPVRPAQPARTARKVAPVGKP